MKNENMLEHQPYYAVQAKRKETGKWYTAHEEDERRGYEIYSDKEEAYQWMEEWKRSCHGFTELPDEFRVVRLIVDPTLEDETEED